MIFRSPLRRAVIQKKRAKSKLGRLKINDFWRAQAVVLGNCRLLGEGGQNESLKQTAKSRRALSHARQPKLSPLSVF